MCQIKRATRAVAASLLPIVLSTHSASAADEARTSARRSRPGIEFTDIAQRQDSGIAYRRKESPRNALLEHIKMKPWATFGDSFFAPTKPHGAPGVALLDFDDDGDEDIYVTNGPGVANSLYVNQLKETGSVSFIDAAVHAGVGAEQQDSSGVCYGDIDNDSDSDLFVLGTCEAHKLFENNGNGTFTDISAKSGIGSQAHCSTTCSMGDVDGDGLLDIVTANTTTHWNDLTALYQHNQLLMNRGGNRFVDASDAAGLTSTFGPQLPGQEGMNGLATITWSIAMVDYDLDGDVDIIQADDQTGDTSVAKGFIQVFQNDGTGHFRNATLAAMGGLKIGGWMGLSFGDLNCDGAMDFFATNFGDYLGPSVNRGKLASRWFLGSRSGRFRDPGVNAAAGASVFGWGTNMADLDNDGDFDIVYHGGEDFTFFIDATNPGVVLSNQGCSGEFLVDESMRSSTNHQRRTVQGSALGDLDNNGFPDIVSVSSFDIPDAIPLVEPPAGNFGAPLDNAAIVQPFAAVPPPAPDPFDQQFVFSGYTYADGTLSVELNNAANGNHWAKIELLGTRGLTRRGVANRDGIGAVTFFRPAKGKSSMRPVVGGSSYASQDSLPGIFGLGKEHHGTVDVLWPGGTRNRLYGVRRGETLLLPEIPCSYSATWRRMRDYRQCVDEALDELVHTRVLTRAMRHRLHDSAIRAYASRRDRDHHVTGDTHSQDAAE